MPKRIYLDTKDWIELLKVEKGKRDGQSPRELPDRLRKLAGAGKIRVLFSAFTVNEIHEYRKKEEQGDLIDLMIDISGLRVLKPYSVFYELEIENALEYVMTGRRVHDIHSQILGKGLDVFGLPYEGFLDSHRELFLPMTVEKYERGKDIYQAMSHDPERVRQFLKDPGAVAVSRRSRMKSESLINEMEDQREKNSALSREAFINHFWARRLYSMEEHVSRLMLARGVAPGQVSQIFPTKARWELFARHLNSLYVLFVLSLQRDRGSVKRISHSDAFDMAHLAGSVPYCDVATADKTFAHLCKKEKLDIAYNCRVLGSLDELSAYLDGL